MRRGLPQTIQDVNVYIDGQGHLGWIESVNLPAITQTMVETKGGIGAKYASGSFEPLEFTFKLSVHDAALYRAFAINTFTNKVPLIFKGSTFQDGESKPIVAIVTGDYEEINTNEKKAGEKEETEIKVSVHVYELLLNKEQAVLADTRNTMLLIWGVDYFAQLRENL